MKISNRWLNLLLLGLLVLPFLITSAPASSNGTTYADTYANTVTGNDGYTGSSATYTSGTTGPKKTISAAIAVTSSDGTVHVAAGTYTERIHLGSNMNLVGAGALTTTIDGNHTGVVVDVSSAPYQTNTISGFTITGGYPAGSYCGGGIYVSSSHIVTINDCAIVGNYKGSGSSPKPNQGGGVCNDNGKVYMNRCTVNGNWTGLQGGGIANLCDFSGSEFGKMWLTNCTISVNAVTGTGAVGGGLYNSLNADVTLLNVTIANNIAAAPTSAGGGFSNSSLSSMYFKNCLVANNMAGVTQYSNGYSGLGSGVNSLGNNLSSDNSCYFTQPSDQVNTNPQLGLLQNNGGPTSTIAIPTASPAYNKGDRSAAPATDQRGVTRPGGAFCSIGAFEPNQQDIRTGTASTTLGQVNFSINAGSIGGLTSLGTANLPCAPSGYSFPYGFFSFNISNLTAGTTVQVTLRFPNPLPTNVKYYKCINGTVFDCSPIMTRPDTNTIVLTLRDGGLGDADGIANGTIADPGGPAFPLSTSPTSHGSSLPQAPQAPLQLSNITVRSASLSAAKVSPGSPVTVTANIANTGTGNGATNIKVYVNGNVEGSQGVTIISGGTSTVTFNVTRSEPGTYTVYVGGTQAGSFTVDEFTPNTVLFISGALVFFAFVIGVIYMVKRRQDY